MATRDAINNTLAAQTGTGKYVGDTNPLITNPQIGLINDAINNVAAVSVVADTASSVNKVGLQCTDSGSNPTVYGLGGDTNITMNIRGAGTGGVNIFGVTDGSNGPSGVVGELISSVIAFASATSYTTGTPKNLTSISLTAGDWDVYGNLFFNGSGAVITTATSWISTTSATQPDPSLYNGIGNVGAVGFFAINSPFKRISVTTTTTVYISGAVTFGSGSVTGCGGIYARRVR